MVDLASNTQRVIQQYQDTKAGDVIEALLGVLQRDIGGPLDEIEDGLSFVGANGSWLDVFGVLVGFPRPSVLSSTFKFYGFAPGDAVLFRDSIGSSFFTTSLGVRDPIDDIAYRRMLVARGITLRNAATVPAVEDACDALFGPGNYELAVSEVNYSYTITVTGGAADTAQFIGVVNTYRDALIPRPAGVASSVTT